MALTTSHPATTPHIATVRLEGSGGDKLTVITNPISTNILRGNQGEFMDGRHFSQTDIIIRVIGTMFGSVRTYRNKNVGHILRKK